MSELLKVLEGIDMEGEMLIKERPQRNKANGS